MSQRALLVGTWVCFVFLTILSAAHAGISDVNPREGTAGTQLALSGSDFGQKQGKVLLGDEKCKVLSWSDIEIKCLITPPQPPGDYTVTVRVQGNKKRSEPIMFSSFAMQAPRITPPASLPLIPDDKVFTIYEAFFGDKKGDVTLVNRRGKTERAKVVDWSMDSIRFEIPRGLTGTCILRVSNEVGEDMYTHPACAAPPGSFVCYDRQTDGPPPGYWDQTQFFENNSSSFYYNGKFFHFTIEVGTLFDDPDIRVHTFENGVFVQDKSIPAGQTYATMVPLVIEGKLLVFATGTNGRIYYTTYSSTGGWESSSWQKMLDVATRSDWEVAPVYNPVNHRIEVYYEHNGYINWVYSYNFGATGGTAEVYDVMGLVSTAPSAVFYQLGKYDETILAVGSKSTNTVRVYLVENGYVVSDPILWPYAYVDFGPVYKRPFLADLGTDYFALIWVTPDSDFPKVKKMAKANAAWGNTYMPLGDWHSGFAPNGAVNHEPDRIFYLLWGYPDCTDAQTIGIVWVMTQIEP